MKIRRNKRDATCGHSPEVRIFDVAEFSRFDGPGIRVVVFFQGCPAHCVWCHSPHSQPHRSPLLYNANLCTGCRRCESVCPEHVHSFPQGEHTLDRSRCTQCGACIENCPSSTEGVKASALHLPTLTIPVDDLFGQIDPYLGFTREKGGITLSGGEALLQADAAAALLSLCKKKGYHTAVETSGLLPLKTYGKVLPLVDLWLFGMRVITGNDGKRHDDHILRVLDFLSSGPGDTLPRIPMIPGFFDREEIWSSIAEMMSRYGLKEVALNPWNGDYAHYYHQSGLPLRLPSPSSEAVRECQEKIHHFINHYKLQIHEN